MNPINLIDSHGDGLHKAKEEKQGPKQTKQDATTLHAAHASEPIMQQCEKLVDSD